MTLIKSISGFRGTLGGKAGETLTPIDIVKFTAAYTTIIRRTAKNHPIKIVIGRDARPSGAMVAELVNQTLVAMGVEVLDCGLSTTPTVEMMVPHFNADGGIILTASHNPVNWNALKLLNNKGEFIDADLGKQLLEIAASEDFEFEAVENLGSVTKVADAIAIHIQKILDLPLVDVEAIKRANFKVAVDAVNSTGGISILPLLDALGVKQVVPLYCEPSGDFPHNPEPLAEHLEEIMSLVPQESCDVGFVVDPDVDRLAIISENGQMFGEEYTLVAVADFLLPHLKGATVSNLSSSRALRVVTEKAGQNYYAAAVGEVNVVEKMKEVNAVIGGEGNGGIIYPELHYGRDALVGIAFFLTHLAQKQCKTSELRASYPPFFMAKKKAQLDPNQDVDALLDTLAKTQKEGTVTTIDGVKIDFENEWVHLRKSNTEPIIRIYTEAPTQAGADALAEKWMLKLQN